MMSGDVEEAHSRRLGLQHGNFVGQAVFLSKGQICRGVLPNVFDRPEMPTTGMRMLLK